jgi:hypothetical protein
MLGGAGMTAKATSFEIQVLQDKRWVLAEVSGDEAGAVAFADNLLQKGNHSAVRVVRDFKRIDGLHSETVIHEKTADDHKKGDLTVVVVSDAPVCREAGDFLALPSRLVIGRVFRRYLDEFVLTPTELLHNAKEMKRLADKDRLLFSAVDSISSLQARNTGEDGKVRRDFLHKAWEDAVARARKAEPDKPPPAKATLADMLKAAQGAAKGDEGAERDYRCRVMMTLRLLETRSWGGKLDTALAWAAEDEAAPQMVLVDGVVADLLMSAELIQDLLGFQANLGAALHQMCDFAEGKAEPAKFAPETFGQINQLMAKQRLPQARDVLLSRVTRELRGANPLSRNEPEREFEMFLQLVNRLISYDGVVGGGAVAEAVAQRHMRLQNVGGAAGNIQAVSGVSKLLGDGCRKTMYLLALADSPLAPVLGTAPLDALSALARSANSIDAWVPLRLSPRDRMAALAACNKAITATPVLADQTRADLATLTDMVMVRYLDDEGVIEKIDKPDDPLALRAIRLVKFCGSGVLIPGQSLERARRRVIDHLRQPQFEEKFLASCTDTGQAERQLREFHRLLVESGFR